MNRHTLPGKPGNVRAAAFVSSLLVLPFLILELASKRAFADGFPIPLFGFMWLSALSFVVVLMRVARALQTGDRSKLNAPGIAAGVVLLIAIGWMWGSLVVDQMPCFLGVPNCD